MSASLLTNSPTIPGHSGHSDEDSDDNGGSDEDSDDNGGQSDDNDDGKDDDSA